MEKIRVENYKSIEDSGWIDLKPITVAVGRNSAGKSSLIRLLPLLKQTIEKRIAEPILWYGDYVDFGDYSNAVCNLHSDKPIKIHLQVKKSNHPIPIRRYKLVDDAIIEVCLSVREQYIDYISLSFFDQKIELDIDRMNKVTVRINDERISVEGSSLLAYSMNFKGELIPPVLSYNDEDPNVIDKRDFFIFFNEKSDHYIYDSAIIKHDDYFRSNNMVEIGSRETILAQLRKINRKKFEKMRVEHKRFMRINNSLIAANLNAIIYAINDSIAYDVNNTNYIKPIRATVERYYRFQGISVDELNSDGSNLPMILADIKKKYKLSDFEKWSKERFGIVFSVKQSEGHISLIVKSDSGERTETNMADTGYGYSQMLPIVMLLWMIHENDMPRMQSHMSKTVVIEQPELHLHPAYQAKMMDVFANIINEAKTKNIDLKIIFETHSETMINRLGALISTGKVSSEDVNVLVFGKKNGVTCISSKQFDSDGLLLEWPVDFFSSEDII